MNGAFRRLCRPAAAGLVVAANAANAVTVAPAAAAAPAPAPAAADDAAVRVIVAKLRTGPPQHPPQTIKRYAIDGKASCHAAALGCDPFSDPFSDLYDARGQHVCLPDGGSTGITGRGDGHRPGTHIDPRERQVVRQGTR